jgi:regulator of nucleoside diphosphate kinase
MYSMGEVADLASGARWWLTLCYPADAEPDDGIVSVRSPVGASLIGRRVGSVVRWRMPDGERVGAEVVALLFQPESSGDYTT